MLCCQSVSPWSSTSTSDSASGSPQSSIKVKEFYYDYEVMHAVYCVIVTVLITE